MKILAVSDVESRYFYDYYTPGKLDEYDLIISCGDLSREYLEFLVTMARCPLLYVHGNHDESYDRRPPEGCICIEDSLAHPPPVVYPAQKRGLRYPRHARARAGHQ